METLSKPFFEKGSSIIRELQSYLTNGGRRADLISLYLIGTSLENLPPVVKNQVHSIFPENSFTYVDSNVGLQRNKETGRFAPCDLADTHFTNLRTGLEKSFRSHIESNYPALDPDTGFTVTIPGYENLLQHGILKATGYICFLPSRNLVLSDGGRLFQGVIYRLVLSEDQVRFVTTRNLFAFIHTYIEDICELLDNLNSGYPLFDHKKKGFLKKLCDNLTAFFPQDYNFLEKVLDATRDQDIDEDQRNEILRVFQNYLRKLISELPNDVSIDLFNKEITLNLPNLKLETGRMWKPTQES